ncbi:Choline binding protein A [Streptococcus gordonii]|uniref:Choline binding protein A n=1 Tax=Streptococcus gordonii TaxID=1302 RepID=A0A139N7Y5_STRGN|nr:Choline binding protein A [Streptococcus gordonii]
MKRSMLFLVQPLLLVGLLTTLVAQDDFSVQAQQIRPQITNHTDRQWIKDKNGWWYKYPYSSFPRNQWQQINGRYYFFNVNGYMLTGWQELDGFGYYKERSW